MNQHLATDQLADIVNEWVSNNPERLAYAYDNTSLFLGWKREAAVRLASSDLPATEALAAFADEAEAAHA